MCVLHPQVYAVQWSAIPDYSLNPHNILHRCPEFIFSTDSQGADQKQMSSTAHDRSEYTATLRIAWCERNRPSTNSTCKRALCETQQQSCNLREREVRLSHAKIAAYGSLSRSKAEVAAYLSRPRAFLLRNCEVRVPYVVTEQRLPYHVLSAKAYCGH